MTKATELAHYFTAQRLSSLEYFEKRAIDATVGNGYDTCFLAMSVGQNGKVLGFDVQDLTPALQLLRSQNLLERCTILQQGHETMYNTVQKIGFVPVHAIMFNCGYLPKSDKTIITNKETTLQALQQAVQILASGGIMTVACYRGHHGGNEETEAVLEWSGTLSQSDFTVLHTDFINQRGSPPELVTIYKR